MLKHPLLRPVHGRGVLPDMLLAGTGEVRSNPILQLALLIKEGPIGEEVGSADAPVLHGAGVELMLRMLLGLEVLRAREASGMAGLLAVLRWEEGQFQPGQRATGLELVVRHQSCSFTGSASGTACHRHRTLPRATADSTAYADQSKRRAGR